MGPSLVRWCHGAGAMERGRSDGEGQSSGGTQDRGYAGTAGQPPKPVMSAGKGVLGGSRHRKTLHQHTSDGSEHRAGMGCAGGMRGAPKQRDVESTMLQRSPFHLTAQNTANPRSCSQIA